MSEQKPIIFNHKKPYFPLSQKYNHLFGEKVYKLSVCIGDICPFRGKHPIRKACSFCDSWGSAAYPQNSRKKLSDQIKIHREIIKSRYKAQKFLVYFQAYTNTLGKLKKLREIFYQALDEPDVVGIVIGTRPDCLPEEILNLFSEIAKKSYISVELGVQTLEDKQLEFLARGHDSQCSISAIEKLKTISGVDVCVHLMFGLPEENDEQLIFTSKKLSQLNVDGVKLHNLHILKNTELQLIYEQGNFIPVDLEEYTRKVGVFLCHLDQKVAVHRLAAVASRWDDVIAPSWVKNKMKVTQFIEDYLNKQNLWQGKFYSNEI